MASKDSVWGVQRSNATSGRAKMGITKCRGDGAPKGGRGRLCRAGAVKPSSNKCNKKQQSSGLVEAGLFDFGGGR